MSDPKYGNCKTKPTPERVMEAAGIDPSTCKSFTITWSTLDVTRLFIKEERIEDETIPKSFKPLDGMRTK